MTSCDVDFSELAQHTSGSISREIRKICQNLTDKKGEIVSELPVPFLNFNFPVFRYWDETQEEAIERTSKLIMNCSCSSLQRR